MIYTYELGVPGDVPDDELEGYRELAISTWHTAVEASGARPGDAEARLISIDEPQPVWNPIAGELLPGPDRAWRVEGPGF